MSEGKVVYKEKCIVEAENREGKSYMREISLVAQEVSRKLIDKTQIIFIEVKFRNGQREEKKDITISDIRFIRDYFLKKIFSAIDLIKK